MSHFENRQKYLGILLTQTQAFLAKAGNPYNAESSRGATRALVNRAKVIISQEVEWLSSLLSIPIRCPHAHPDREHCLFPLIPQRLGMVEGN